MKSFFKTTFACVLGVFIAGILLFWLFIGSVISLATFSTTPSYTSKENTILILKLEGELTERAKDDPLNILNSGEYIPKAGLDEILKLIRSPNVTIISLVFIWIFQILLEVMPLLKKYVMLYPISKKVVNLLWRMPTCTPKENIIWQLQPTGCS